MDKSWMHADRRSKKFELGVAEFLKLAESNANNKNKISCPCLKCSNTKGFSVGVIKDHIFWNGINESYKHWRWHGEPTTSAMNDNRVESETVDWEPGLGENDWGFGESEDEQISEDSNEFLKYVEDGDQPLYPGCTKTTKLNGLIQTFNLKAKHGMTDACYSDMLIRYAIFRRDVYAMTNMKEVSAGCIVMYMSFLYQVLKKSKMLDMIGFVDPANTGIIGCGNPTERARSLSVSYERGKPGQIFLVPYNSGGHWMLTVANPTEEVVYFMDPLKRRLITGEWRTIVDNSIKIFNAQKHRKGRKTVQWKNCAGIPEQMGDKTCGYWIMHYMRDIVEDKNQEWSAKWERKANHYYTMENVDAVRAEWAKYVMKFKDN